MSSLQELAARTSDERLKRLLSFLAADPENITLRCDAAEQALNAGAAGVARELIERGAPARLDDRELNLLGVAEMQLGEFSKAAARFEDLLARGAGGAATKFNLAWSLAMEKQLDKALGLLSEDVTAALPQAAMLEVQLRHGLGEFEDAAEAARRHVAAFPEHEGLAAAVSVLALDIDDLDLARRCAERGGNHPHALATLGTLALGEQRADEAFKLFDRALRTNDRDPRAWVGRGLSRLVAGDRGAAADIDRGAEQFGDHLGSWIAAGWAHLIAGDSATARNRFEQALALDGNFAESHGSLAVVDVIDGKEKAAAKEIAVARRLDRECFSAAFAQVLIKATTGQGDRARTMFRKILETPVNERGDTAAAALARLGLG